MRNRDRVEGGEVEVEEKTKESRQLGDERRG
jgi:hypothetical protein